MHTITTMTHYAVHTLHAQCPVTRQGSAADVTSEPVTCPTTCTAAPTASIPTSRSAIDSPHQLSCLRTTYTALTENQKMRATRVPPRTSTKSRTSPVIYPDIVLCTSFTPPLLKRMPAHPQTVSPLPPFSTLNASTLLRPQRVSPPPPFSSSTRCLCMHFTVQYL